MISFIKIKLMKHKKLIFFLSSLCFIFIALCFILIAYLIYISSLPSTSATNYIFVTKWGSKGFGNGEFIKPADITVSRKGYVYVADYGNGSIQKFDSRGTFISKWNCDKLTDLKYCSIERFDSRGNFISSWNYDSLTEEQYCSIKKNDPGYTFLESSLNYTNHKYSNIVFNEIWPKVKIAVDSKGNVYVIDNGKEIKKFDSNGKFIKQFSYNYEEKGEKFLTKVCYYEQKYKNFKNFICIAIDPLDHIFVVTKYSLMVFTPDGNLLFQKYMYEIPQEIAVDKLGYCYMLYHREESLSAGFYSYGYPYLTIENTGLWGLKWPRIYEYKISLGKEFTTKKFSPNRTILDLKGHKFKTIIVPPIPVDIAIDLTKGDIFAVHPGDNCVMKFSPSNNKGGYIMITEPTIVDWFDKFGGSEKTESMHSLENQTFSHDELIEKLKKLSFNEKEIKFILNHSTKIVTQWGSKGTGDGQFNCPRGIAVDSEGNVYVADTGNHRIQKFAPKD